MKTIAQFIIAFALALASSLRANAESEATQSNNNGLFAAIARNDVAAVQALLAADVKAVLAETLDGSTPLHAAARADAIEILYLLTKAGMSRAVKDANGLTALDVARDANAPDAILYLGGSGVQESRSSGVQNVPLRPSTSPVEGERPREPPPNAPLPPSDLQPSTSPVEGERPREPPPNAPLQPSDLPPSASLPLDADSLTPENIRARFPDLDTLYFPEGEYLGETDTAGRPHGLGTKTFLDQSRYTGEWRKGRREGTGLYIYPTGDTFHGSWRNHAPDGQGLFTFANGGHAKGTWSRGILKEATGIYVDPKGVRYNAIWRNNELIRKTLIPQ